MSYKPYRRKKELRSTSDIVWEIIGLTLAPIFFCMFVFVIKVLGAIVFIGSLLGLFWR